MKRETVVLCEDEKRFTTLPKLRKWNKNPLKEFGFHFTHSSILIGHLDEVFKLS